jgi:aspartyl-tRNA(Asn)/glutamyl-tRNA(Gln) amidotransferase subunit C
MTDEEIKNLAHLALIEMTDEEIVKFRSEIDPILEYVAQINAVQIDDIDVPQLQTNVARADVARTDDYNGQELLAGAPDSQDGFYKVPKILASND